MQTTDDSGSPILEGAETFTVSVSDSSGVLDTGAGTIVDDGRDIGGTPADNDQPTYSIDSVVVSEGGVATFTVSRTGDALADQTVTVATSIGGGDSAEADDFTGKTQDITFAPGETSKTFTVQTTDDSALPIFEGEETFSIDVSDGSGILASGTGTIVDDGRDIGGTPADNDFPTVSISSVNNTAIEGGANNTVSFVIAQDNVSESDTTVNATLTLGDVETADLNATVDYIDANGDAATTTVAALVAGLEITIPAGSSYTPEFVLTVLDDAIYEVSESLSMAIALASGETDAQISGSADSATATIYDEDSTPGDGNNDQLGDLPALNIATSVATATEGGSDYVVFDVVRTGDTEVDSTFKLTIGGDIEASDIASLSYSVNGVDWIAFTNGGDLTLSAADADATLQVRVEPTNDDVFEQSESLTATIAAASTGEAVNIGTAIANGSFVDEDSTPGDGNNDQLGDLPALNIATSVATATEGGSDYVVFDVVRTGDTEVDSTFKLTIGGDVEASDIASLSYSVNGVDWIAFTNGGDLTLSAADVDATLQVRVEPTNDDVFEQSESLTATIAAASTGEAVNIGTATANGSFVDEDGSTPGDQLGDQPELNISTSVATATEGGSDYVVFDVVRTGDTEVDSTFKLTIGGDIEASDIASLSYSVNGVDWIAFTNGGDLTLSAADAAATLQVRVEPTNDDVFEQSESLTATIAAASTGEAVNIGTATANGSFVDEDGSTPGDQLGDQPELNISTSVATATEGGSDYVVFDVVRTGDTEVDSTFKLTIGGDIEASDIASLSYSVNGVDWIAFTNGGDLTLSAADADATLQVRVEPTNDDVFEQSESLTATIVAASTGEAINIGTATANGSFVDEDSTPGDGNNDQLGDLPTVSISSINNDALEGSGNNTVSFVVAQDNVSESDISITVTLDLNTVETIDLSSIVNYLNANGTSATTTVAALVAGLEITLPANSNYTPEFIFTVLDDVISEVSESLSMSLSSAVGAQISASANSATATISDNDVSLVLDLDGDDSTRAGLDYQTTYAAGGVTIATIDADLDIDIQHGNNTNLKSATITLVNNMAGDELVSSPLAGMTVANTGTQITITADDAINGMSVADFEAAIASIVFSNTETIYDPSTREIQVAVTDINDIQSNTATSYIVSPDIAITIDAISLQEDQADSVDGAGLLIVNMHDAITVTVSEGSASTPEALESLVIVFDSPLVAGAEVFGGTLAGDGMTFTIDDPAAAYGIKLPADYSTDGVANSTDNNAAALTYTVTATSNHGSVSESAVPDYPGDENTAYQVGTGITVTATGDVESSAVNATATHTAGDAYTDVQLALDGWVSDTDSSEQILPVSIIFDGLPPGVIASVGTLNGNTWTPNSGDAIDAYKTLSLKVPSQYVFSINATLMVSSDEAGVHQSPFTVTLLDDPSNNSAPVIDPLSKAIYENTTYVATIKATDTDSLISALSYRIDSSSPNAALFTIDATTGVLSFIKPPRYEDSNGTAYEVAVIANDGNSDSASQLMTISVQDTEPEAQSDMRFIAKVDGVAVATGNVLTPDAAQQLTGDIADNLGEDGIGSLLSVSYTNGAGVKTEQFFNLDPADDGAESVSITTDYGEITVKANGDYSYTLNNAAGIPLSAEDLFSYTMTDGDRVNQTSDGNGGWLGGDIPLADADTSTATLSINIGALTRLDLDADDSSNPLTSTGHLKSYFDGNGAVAIADTDTIIDQSGGVITLTKAEVTLTNTKTGDDFTFVDGNGVAVIGGVLPYGNIAYTVTTDVSGNRVINLVGTASVEDYQLAIAAIRFSNSEAHQDTEDRIIEVKVGDDNAWSNSAISVVEVVDAPSAYADALTLTENASQSGTNLLLNDVDMDTAAADLALTSIRYTDGGGDVVVVDFAGQASLTFTTEVGGTVTVYSDGNYDYTAPKSLDHSDATLDQDSFDYQVSDGILASDWTAVDITIDDTAPVAMDDLNGLRSNVASGNVITGEGQIVDAGLYAGGGADTETGDTLTGLHSDDANNIGVVYEGTTYYFADVGQSYKEVTISSDYGDLVIRDDGSYVYTKSVAGTVILAAGNTVQDWTSTVDIYGFRNDTTYRSGANIDKSILANASELGSAADTHNDGQGAELSGSGLGVAGGSRTEIDSSEAIVIDLHGEARQSVDIQLSGFIAPFTKAGWRAYDINGNVISTGNEGSSSFTVSASQDIRYIEFTSTAYDFYITSISYEVVPPALWQDQVFEYTLIDADGSTTTAELTIQDTFPTTVAVAADTNSVYESGLDTNGSEASTDKEIASGNLLDNDSAESISHFIVGAGTPVAVSGASASYTTAYGELTVYFQDGGGYKAGDYVYTLTGNTTDHTGANDDSLTEVFTYRVDDSADPAANPDSTSTLTVTIHDDTPNGNPVIDSMKTQAEPNITNLTLVLDSSGSMRADVDGKSYLEFAVAALKDLIAAADAAGNVNIHIIDFDNDIVSSGWIVDDVEAAYAFLDTMDEGGTTNYKMALEEVMAVGNGPANADTSSVYFLSDGVPYPYNSARVDATTEANWKDYLSNGGEPINAYGVGIGTGSVDLKDLQPIAYPQADKAFVLTDVRDLSTKLLETLSDDILAGTLGLLGTANGSGILLGADGGFIEEIVIDGDTYSFDFDNKEISRQLQGAASAVVILTGASSMDVITDLGGELNFNFETGEYNYVLKLDDNLLDKEVFDVTAIDGDGDTLVTQVIFNIDYQAKLDANRDFVTKLDGGTVEIPMEALLWNDIGPLSEDDGVSTRVDGDASLVDGIVSTDKTSFTYSLDKNSSNIDQAKVVVEQASGQNITGSEQDDILVGNAGDNTLVGGGGLDALVGGAGDDTLFGGMDEDILFGGSGHDTMDGGAGSDMFVFQQGDADGTDTINNFVTTSIGANDILNLADLLQDEENNSIDGYLAITKDGSDSLISVDIAGDGGAADHVIRFDNIDLLNWSQTTLTSEQALQEMLASGSLIVDE
ncbi:hypothetical protein SIN8267_03583 [Sinobacterium norvegicum]|uniref:Cadherin domain-containing protein n=1 Tax=Sinobacterium norvegicum TaxID=1641715 RepID=A0ABN8EM25_9GAMM|nr:Calx-beta domain-containing protein [Sinobacterium norvegicum]CAH0993433.1 hypothetical protein SIN8267_03583 [Sinobacterium norvegicum]